MTKSAIMFQNTKNNVANMEKFEHNCYSNSGVKSLIKSRLQLP